MTKPNKVLPTVSVLEDRVDQLEALLKKQEKLLLALLKHFAFSAKWIEDAAK